MKVQDLLAVVGGLMKTLLVIGRFLVKPISKLSLHSELVNELFVFEEQRNRRIRKSFQKQNSINSTYFNFETFQRQDSKLKRELAIKEPDSLSQNGNFTPNAPKAFLNQRDRKYQSNILQPRLNEKSSPSPQPQVIPITSQRNEIAAVEQVNNQVRSNSSLFRLEHLEQKGIQNSKKYNESQKRQSSSSDAKNTAFLPKDKVNIKNSIKNNNSSRNSLQQNQYNSPQPKSFQQNQIILSINTSSDKYKPSSCQTPKSKFQKEASLAQQHNYDLINLQKLESHKSLEKEELGLQFETNDEEEEKIKRNAKVTQNIVSLDGKQYEEQEQKQEEESQKMNQFEKQTQKVLELQPLNNTHLKKIDSQTNRRANKIMTVDACVLQKNSVKIDADLKRFQSNQNEFTNRSKQVPNVSNNQEEQQSQPKIRTKFKNKTQAAFTRKGTTLITEILQKNYQVQRGIRKATKKEQREDNAQFSNELENMQEKPLRFTCFDYIKYYFGKLKCISKKKQIKYSVKKVTERLDIIYILQKLVEIDKLKVLLLSYDQQKLFEYMPKPVVQNDPEKYEHNLISGKLKADHQKNWTLLNSEKDKLDKFTEAFHAYKQIQTKFEKEPLDDRLISMLDPDVKRYFDITKVDASQICTPHKISGNSVLLPNKFNYQEQGQSLKPSQALTNPQIQSIKLQQQKQDVQMRKVSSEIEPNYNSSQQQNQKNSISPSGRNRMIGDQTNRNAYSSIQSDNVKFQQLLAPNGDLMSPKSTQQFIQSQQFSQQQFSQQQFSQQQFSQQLFSHPSLLLKNVDNRKQQSNNEQVYNVEDDVEGQISYPRASICFNHRDSVDLNTQINKLGQLSLNDNQFSFARRSIESPYFMFDFQKKSLNKQSNVTGSRSNQSKRASNAQIGVPMAQSKDIAYYEDEENSNDPEGQISPDQINNGRLSPYKLSPTRKFYMSSKKRSLSQQDLENINEQLENENHHMFINNNGNQNKNISFGNQYSMQSHEAMSNSYHNKMERSSALRQAAILTSSGQINEKGGEEEEGLPQKEQSPRNKLNTFHLPRQTSLFYKDKMQSSLETRDNNNNNYYYNNNQDQKQYLQNTPTLVSQDHFSSTPPLLAFRLNSQNSPMVTHLNGKHKKNVNSVGSQNSLSNIKKDSFNLNSSYSKESPLQEFDGSGQAKLPPRLFIKNPFDQNSNQYSKEDKGQQDHSRNIDSLRNQVQTNLASFQSFQSVPEENLDQQRDDIKQSHINPNKFKDEIEYKFQDQSQDRQRYANFTQEQFNLRNNLQAIQCKTEQNTPHHFSHLDSPQRISAPSHLQNSPQIIETLVSDQEDLNETPYKIQRLQYKNKIQRYSSPNSNELPLHIQQTNSILGNSPPNNLLFNNIEMENSSNKQNFIQINNGDLYQEQRPIRNAEITQQKFIAHSYQQNNPTNVQLSPDQQHQSSLNSSNQQQKQQKSTFGINPTSPQNTNNLLDINQEQLSKQRFSSINFNRPTSVDMNENLSKQLALNLQNNSNQSIQNLHQRASLLNLQLNINSNVQSMNSPHIQNFLKQNNNNNVTVFDSPYTQQQKYLKKKQQEKALQSVKKDSQYNPYNSSQNVLTAQNRTTRYSQQQNQIFFNFDNIERIKALENSGHKSENSLSNVKSEYQKSVGTTPNQRSFSKSQNEANNSNEYRKSIINQDIILTTEHDENKDFISREKQQSLSPNDQFLNPNSNLIEFSRSSRRNSNKESIISNSAQNKESLHDEGIMMGSTSNTKRITTLLIPNNDLQHLDKQKNQEIPYNLIKISDQDNFQTLNSESDPMQEFNFNKGKLQQYVEPILFDEDDDEDQKQQQKYSNNNVIIFDERDSDEKSNHDDSVHLNKSSTQNTKQHQRKERKNN